MASLTLRASDRFPAGTSVGAYPESQWAPHQLPPEGAPLGAATESQSMGADGEAEFTALAADTSYRFGAEVGGTWRYVGGATLEGLGSAPDFGDFDDGDVAAWDAGDQQFRGQPTATPGAHAASHTDGGADEITATIAQTTGLQTALDAKAPLASPALTGNPTAPTQVAGNSTTRLATTAFVAGEVATESAARVAADALLAPLISPALTDTPTAPTAAVDTNTTQLATTAFVVAQGYLKSADATTLLAAKQSTSEKGAVDGYASLDGAGRVPFSQLPVSAMEYKGNWNATTNDPALADGTGSTGDQYRVSVAGTQNLGSGAIVFDVGDYAIYNGATWEKADTTDAVASVAGKTGAVALVSSDVGLGNVDNTTDTGKPVSTAQQTALDLKAPLAAPTFTGVPAAPTPAVDTNTTQLATTAFVIGQGYLKAATAATTYQPLDATLTALAAHNTNGLLTQTAADTFTGRTLTGDSEIAVANGSGVAGNPTLSIGAAIARLASPAFTGTVTSAGIFDCAKPVRATGSGSPASGTGVEILWTGSAGYLIAIDRAGPTLKPLFVDGITVDLAANDVTKVAVNGTGVGLNGNTPVAKAASIASPTSDALGTKVAIDAIRVALTNIGITA